MEKPPEKKNKWGYLKTWFTLSKPKPPEPEVSDEDQEVLATRFISFAEGSIVVLQYLPLKPMRDYGPFTSLQQENAKPLPTLSWDSQIVYTNRVNNLRQVNLLNYEMISQMEEPEDSLVEV